MTTLAGDRPASPPVAAFGAVMGLTGLGLAWRFAQPLLGTPPMLSEAIIAVAAALFAVLCVMYVLKGLRHPRSVQMEFSDAAAAPYFGTIVISAALLAYAAVPYSQTIATFLWAAASITGLLLLIVLTGRSVSDGVDLSKISAAWLIPVIGNAATVYAGCELGLREAAIASFAVAAIYYLTLLPLIFYRLIFGERLPVRNAPSMAVLISSPAVLSIAAYLIAGPSIFFDILVSLALFNLLLVASLWKMAAKLPFSAGIWAYSFSTAELSGAVLHYHQSVPGSVSAAIAITVLSLATAVTAGVLVWSLSALARPLFAARVSARVSHG